MRGAQSPTCFQRLEDMPATPSVQSLNTSVSVVDRNGLRSTMCRSLYEVELSRLPPNTTQNAPKLAREWQKRGSGALRP